MFGLLCIYSLRSASDLCGKPIPPYWQNKRKLSMCPSSLHGIQRMPVYISPGFNRLFRLILRLNHRIFIHTVPVFFNSLSGSVHYLNFFQQKVYPDSGKGVFRSASVTGTPVFLLYGGTLFSDIVEKFQQTCPADAGGILESLPRSFTTFRMAVSNQHYSRTAFTAETGQFINHP